MEGVHQASKLFHQPEKAKCSQKLSFEDSVYILPNTFTLLGITFEMTLVYTKRLKEVKDWRAEKGNPGLHRGPKESFCG